MENQVNTTKIKTCVNECLFKRQRNNMKYLGIHKLLWFIIVVAYTLFEGLWFLIIWVVYVLWNFRFPRKLWSESHKADYPFQNHWGGYKYCDKNIWQTIIRRYSKTFC